MCVRETLHSNKPRWGRKRSPWNEEQRTGSILETEALSKSVGERRRYQGVDFTRGGKQVKIEGTFPLKVTL